MRKTYKLKYEDFVKLAEEGLFDSPLEQTIKVLKDNKLTDLDRRDIQFVIDLIFYGEDLPEYLYINEKGYIIKDPGVWH